MTTATGGGGHPPTLLGGTAIKPVERSGFESFKYFLHDPENGTFFTRTPKSWALITLFYIIYYSLLAAFWYGMLMAFFSTLPTDKPKWVLDESIIGSNPGLGLRPKQIDARIDSSLILISEKADANQSPSQDFETPSNADWAKRAELYLNHFENDTDLLANCPDGVRSKSQKQGCVFDKAVLGNCMNYPFGYLPSPTTNNKIAPCVFFKPNRLFNWEPMTYENAEEVDNDTYLPDHVKEMIKNGMSKIYIDCQGENKYDLEGLTKNSMNYYPEDQGIDMKYFPYSGGNYHNPTVAVQFIDLQPGRLYHIECKLWGKGIKHDSKDRMGLVHFEIMLNDALSFQ